MVSAYGNIMVFSNLATHFVFYILHVLETLKASKVPLQEPQKEPHKGHLEEP